MVRTLRTAARKSRLSLLQVKELAGLVPELTLDVCGMDTAGDLRLDVPLTEAPSDFFTDSLDAALIEGKADIAVHSAKDLPYPLHPGIRLIALTKAFDQTDAIVTRSGQKLSGLPAGSKVASSSALRRQNVLTANPGVVPVNVRGDIISRLAQLDRGDFDALVVASCALIRLGLGDRITERLPFATHPLQGCLAVTASAGRAEELAPLFAGTDIRKSFGSVHLIGFGPGDPELMTVRGERLLRESDAIVYDALTDADFVKSFPQEKFYVGKLSGSHSADQAEINALLLRLAREGKTVARLKGGDPMIFAHGREELDFLRSNLIEADVTPGITAASAAAASAGIPLTHRGLSSSCVLLSGHPAGNDSLERRLESVNADTMVFYMAGKQIGRVAAALIAKGKSGSTPVAVTSRASLKDEKTIITTLSELRLSVLTLRDPVLLTVGGTAGLSGFRHVRLDTGTSPAPSRGDFVTHVPFIDFEGIEEPELTGEDVRDGGIFILTSPQDVRFFMALIRKWGIELPRKRFVVAVGRSTAGALASYGVFADAVPADESAAGIADLVRSDGLLRTYGTVVYPHSDISPAALAPALVKAGFNVKSAAVYRTVPRKDIPDIDISAFDQVDFASPSGAEAFAARFGGLQEGKQYLCRGETTLRKVRELAGSLAL